MTKLGGGNLACSVWGINFSKQSPVFIQAAADLQECKELWKKGSVDSVKRKNESVLLTCSGLLPPPRRTCSTNTRNLFRELLDWPCEIKSPRRYPNLPSPPIFVQARSWLKRFMTRSRPLHAKHRLRRDEKLDLLDSFKSMATASAHILYTSCSHDLWCLYGDE